MVPGKRTYAALSAVVAAVLSGVVLRDVYVDWQFQGKPLWSTVAENAVPLVLGVVVFLVGQWAYRRKDRLYVENVARWQVYGAVAIAVIVGWVVAFQAIQGEFKPYLVVGQTTIGGAVAGTLIGYYSARRAESLETAQKERDSFEALFERMPAETAQVRLTGGELVLERVNPGFETVFGVAADGNRTLGDAVSHGEDELATFRERIGSGETHETETVLQRGDVTEYYQVRIAPYGDENRAYLIYTDVSELVETKEELERTVSRLERSNRRLEDFAHVASHNLQEPLRTVSSFAEILAEDYGDELDERGQENVETVVTGARRMQSMVDGLLDYSRVTESSQEFEAVDCEALAEEVVENLESLREREDGTVTVEPLPTVEGDQDQLWQVFHELVRNALEHSGEGPVAITVRAEETEDGYRFAVEDDGPGIDPNLQDDVFRMYESGEVYRRTAEEKGVGLAVADRIVSRHGGEMWVDSEPGEGSTFRFTIAKT